MVSERVESTVSLVVHANKTGSQVITNTGQVLKEFVDSDDYQANLKAAEAWLAEQGFVHIGQSNYAKYDPLMTGDTSESKYE
jgi:coproporphyrinogen III oxidase-like Fe-S oxidoreductase